MKRHWCATFGCLAAILTARAYVQKRVRQFLADSANLKRNITVEAMAARGLTTGHDVMRDFKDDLDLTK
ncbi:hypothetical protein [Dermabacter vaginalis]|uniref:Uncharacterized protein n=1 Tax=Dermabacter vaginalis TaxID=1630135 RepID=A0ABX6A5J9_9MICO|nr:hypothetical protein [Dermabacter vaginalis]QEU11626.1 hypothetical protein FOB48_04510 [Dermabacter vaginalis]